MNQTGNRDAGGRNLSTADLAAAGRRPSQVDERDDELDDPATDRKGELPSSAAERGSASMADRSAVEHRSAPMADRSAVEHRSAPMTDRPVAAKPATDSGAEQLEPLFSSEMAGDYRARWAAVQSSFVDDPRRAVREGDELVAQMMKDLAESFAAERGRLETQLGRAGGDDHRNVARFPETIPVVLRASAVALAASLPLRALPFAGNHPRGAAICSKIQGRAA
jgi:hypothetical protein